MIHHLLTALTGSVLSLAPTAAPANGSETHVHAPTSQQDQEKDQLARTFSIPGLSPGELKTRAARDETITLGSIPLPDGTLVDAAVRVHDPFGPDFSFSASSIGPGGRSVRPLLDMASVTLLKGHIKGRKDSTIILASQGDRVEGFITIDDRTAIITKDRTEGASRNVVFYPSKNDLKPPADLLRSCGTEGTGDLTLPQLSEPEGGLAGSETTCHVIRLAFEIDYELYHDQFNRDGLATLVYIAKLLYSTNEIARRNFGAEVVLAAANVWEDVDNPWDQPNTLSQLNQFADYCNDLANGVLEIPRDATNFLTSRILGGGRAGGIGALACHQRDNAYMVSGSLVGSFPYPAVDHHQDNWDIFVFVHELGHLLGAIHTHAYDPPLDTCRTGNRDAENGTIMSYCHECTGGTRNIGLQFHMRNQERVKSYLDAINCLKDRTASMVAYDDAAWTFPRCSVTIDVLVNDASVCSGAEIFQHDFISTKGGFVRLQVGSGPLGRDVLRYTPPDGFFGLYGETDDFSYLAVDAHGNIAIAQVVIDIAPMPLLDREEYLVLDIGTRSISRMDAETHVFRGMFLPEYSEILADPSSILPLTNTSVLVGDRGLQKVLQFDINGEYQGVFFEHSDLIHCEAMVQSGEDVFILDAYGGWVFRTGLSGGSTGAFFKGLGEASDLTLGDDGTLWITGSVNGMDVIGIDPQTGEIRHEIADLQGIDAPGAVAFSDGQLQVADVITGAIGRYEPYGSGHPKSWLITAEDALWNWLGGGIEFAEGPFDDIFGSRFGLVTTNGLFEVTEIGSVLEISRNERDRFQMVEAIALREVPETSPDINLDGCVDGGDLSLLLSYFNEPTASFYRADLDLDGKINGADLTILLGAWSGCP